MKMTLHAALATALALAFLPAALFAQPDPGPNSVGIYFDQAATEIATPSAAPTPEHPVEVRAWLIARHVSLAGLISYWEGDIRTSGAYGNIVGMATAGQNIADNMMGEQHWSFRVWVSTPFPVTDTLILANVYVGLYESGGPTWLYVEGLNMSVSGSGVSLSPASGSASSPVAVINGATPVAEQPTTWGQVKSIFR
jgi:hypothetical protein